jgi:hypothetical protein
MSRPNPAPTSSPPPEGEAISILIEMDNLRRRGLPRAALSLEALRRELDATDRPIEVLIGVPADAVPNWLPPLLDTSGITTCVEPQLICVGNEHYYQVKNHLAERATGSLLVFVDIDVIVEPGWLAGLLDPFADHDVVATFGDTAVGPLDGWYERAIAAMWIYDPRSVADGGEPHGFWGNNVAVRADVFPRYGFEPLDGEFRGACARLEHRLRSDGFKVVHAPAARTLHPAPSMPGDFTAWCLATSGDHGIRLGRRAPWRATTRGVLIIGYSRLLSLRAIVARRRAIDLPWWELPIAVALVIYSGVVNLIGFSLGRWAPRRLQRFQ